MYVWAFYNQAEEALRAKNRGDDAFRTSMHFIFIIIFRIEDSVCSLHHAEKSREESKDSEQVPPQQKLKIKYM